MTIQEAIKARHSVRQYTEQPIEAEKIQQLHAPIDLGIAKCHFEIGAGEGSFQWL